MTWIPVCSTEYSVSALVICVPSVFAIFKTLHYISKQYQNGFKVKYSFFAPSSRGHMGALFSASLLSVSPPTQHTHTRPPYLHQCALHTLYHVYKCMSRDGVRTSSHSSRLFDFPPNYARLFIFYLWQTVHTLGHDRKWLKTVFTFSIIVAVLESSDLSSQVRGRRWTGYSGHFCLENDDKYV